MSVRIMGRKIGMTQIFNDQGQRLPVTVVKVDANHVVSIKSEDGADGYNAVKVGFEFADKQEKDGQVRYRGVNSAEAGVFTKADLAPMRHVREFRVKNADDLKNFEVGQELGVGQFRVGQFVDVSGTSKGRGFSGVMRRHNFGGFRATHGTHESFRGGGSIGMSADPARVLPGMKMPGQLGNKRATVQNLEIVRIDADDNLLLIKGAIPGPTNGLVEVTQAVKKARREQFNLDY